MDARQAILNTHHQDPARFWENDHHLRLLSQMKYQYRNDIIDAIPRDIPGIYSIGGGRQVGKTTILKQWMGELIQSGVDALSIVFFTGEMIDTHHDLVQLVQNYLSAHASYTRFYIVLDEITYIKDWEKGVKFLADAGLLSHVVMVITGSDLSLMQSARKTFPGRRGPAEQVDFHVYPLDFRETLRLKNQLPTSDNPSFTDMQKLYQHFAEYLRHGGFLTAINDVAQHGDVRSATLQTYSDWIRGDMLKRGKQEMYLKEIVEAIILRYNTQLSWHALADAISIDSHKTVQDYCELLQDMDALFVQPAILLDKLVGAPKKARKFSFSDPFIYHALRHWIDNAYQIEHAVADPMLSAAIVEAAVATTIRRAYPTYYIKSQGEIDVVYVKHKKAYPIEVKWRKQVRPQDVKQLKGYPRSVLWAKTMSRGEVDGIPVVPLPLALALMEIA